MKKKIIYASILVLVVVLFIIFQLGRNLTFGELIKNKWNINTEEVSEISISHFNGSMKTFVVFD